MPSKGVKFILGQGPDWAKHHSEMYYYNIWSFYSKIKCILYIYFYTFYYIIVYVYEVFLYAALIMIDILILKKSNRKINGHKCCLAFDK